MGEVFQEEIRQRRKKLSEISGFGYEKKYDEIYNELTKQMGYGFFETKKDVLVLAGMIGFNLFSSKSKKIENHKLERTEFRQLSPVDFSEYYHLIYSVALSLNNNIEDILDNKRVVDIFNNCASLGIDKLFEILKKDGDGYVRNFEDFLESPEEFLEDMFDEKREEREINEAIGILV
ncbi:hypothetical protein [Candidatus Cetobacterium colombiensis]|uniref:DNA phosphorothioation-associated protein 4 n=1 Tax=Candidatus Cetobacterium colombiensis TaxID=3073100 RepID=A0ABU4W6Q8_9FUSO|nr:hypothetical protein [Candidatus Cetobacterium colombiensis]MDX8335218.1 hypothetical protein [Candidatus Cetobacterium colombiensis]